VSFRFISAELQLAALLGLSCRQVRELENILAEAGRTNFRMRKKKFQLFGNSLGSLPISLNETKALEV
jgi:hypothetical protein